MKICTTFILIEEEYSVDVPLGNVNRRQNSQTCRFISLLNMLIDLSFRDLSDNHLCTSTYRDEPTFLVRRVCANTVDSDQSDQGLHCLSFRLHL